MEILACSWPLLTNVVVRLLPFHRTTEPEIKFVPFTVRVKPAPPADALLGATPLRVGTGFTLVIVNVKPFEVPPPGVGLNTVTWALPACPISTLVMLACSWLLLTKLVVRLLPFHFTTEPAIKLVPFTVKVKPASPADALLGVSPLRVGTGFTLLIVNVRALDVPPLGAGLNTVTFAVPATAISTFVKLTCSWVLLTKVVFRLAPFHCTTDSEINLVPFTVKVKPGPPADALLGDKLLSEGTGLSAP